MWFIADLFEKYTNSVARSFIKFATMEAEASREAQERLRQRAQRCTVPEPDEEARAAVAPSSAPEAPAVALSHEIPVGVRGDVVVHYVAAFAAVEHGEPAAELIERMRKDKKVRVPELLLVCAEVLDEEPTNRKKAEYLDALRGHFGVAPAAAAKAPAGPQPEHA